MTARYYARIASDKTDNWPFWFVADSSRGGLNVTPTLINDLSGHVMTTLPFLPKSQAERLAEISNRIRP
jgi:hypothetical protein